MSNRKAPQKRRRVGKARTDRKMVQIFCAVIQEGSIFPMEIERSKTVHSLKVAVVEKQQFDFPASEITLFLAKADGQWLSGDDPIIAELLSDRIRAETAAQFLNEELIMKPFDLLDRYFSEELNPQDRKIHVLVQLPGRHIFLSDRELARLSTLNCSVRKFSRPVKFFLTDVNDGILPEARTLRSSTIDRLLEILDRDHFVFIHAPPLSGKSTLCDLIHNRLCLHPEMLVARVRVRPGDNDFFKDFELIYECSFSTFSRLRRPRAVLIDEAQNTYNSETLWKCYIKPIMQGRHSGLKIVLFSAYGSYLHYPLKRAPIELPLPKVIGLNATNTNPGLRLSRFEFDELINGTIGAVVADEIWRICSGHVGIATGILQFLDLRFGRKVPGFGREEVVHELVSDRLIGFFRNTSRGIPTAHAFNEMMREKIFSEEVVLTMSQLLNDIAAGGRVSTDDAGSSEYHEAVDQLIRTGYLYEEPFPYEGGSQQLQFASQMHLRLWLFSIRSDPVTYMITDISQADFVVVCIQRMSSTRLKHIASMSSKAVVRERPMQMELYRATISCVSRKIYVTPEWRTPDGKGWIDLMISDDKFVWIWELLVEGVDAVKHSKRFQTGGSYHPVCENARYVLIDFRQNVKVRKQKPGFLYVTFSESYKKAKIFGIEFGEKTVELAV